ncbi:MAG: hypothetical protein AAB853_05160, partial [Patescibacteria group bacterium]
MEEYSPIDIDKKDGIKSDERTKTNWIQDRVVTAVAADLVTQFFKVGTNPTISRGDDLIAFRSFDLVPLYPENLALGKDPKGKDFLFSDVQEWARDAVLLAPEDTCRRYPWWLPSKPPPLREPREPEVVDGEKTTYPECVFLVLEVRDAVQREWELLSLREELSIIAYGSESVFDGQSSATGAELRTYDLLLDLAAVS